jgi:hypothetical protein
MAGERTGVQLLWRACQTCRKSWHSGQSRAGLTSLLAFASALSGLIAGLYLAPAGRVPQIMSHHPIHPRPTSGTLFATSSADAASPQVRAVVAEHSQRGAGTEKSQHGAGGEEATIGGSQAQLD